MRLIKIRFPTARKRILLFLLKWLLNTHEFATRIILDENNQGRVTALGESQLFGLDFLIEKFSMTYT